jgi:hypothetical protein
VSLDEIKHFLITFDPSTGDTADTRIMIDFF